MGVRYAEGDFMGALHRGRGIAVLPHSPLLSRRSGRRRLGVPRPSDIRCVLGCALTLALLAAGALSGATPAAAQPHGSAAPPLVLLALQQAQLIASDGAPQDWFGFSVALDGETALVGTPYDDVGATPDQGTAYVFVRSGTTWSQQAQLAASDGAGQDCFGYSVALDGETALVGAPYDDVGATTDQGTVYVFARSGTTWSQQAQLVASDGAGQDCFGESVALAGDTVVVGTSWHDANATTDQGAAYVFVRNGTTWSQQAQLVAADGASQDRFGYSVALDGETALVGAPYDDVDSDVNQGSAYVFVRSGTSWSQQAQLIASGGASQDRFGYSVALDGETALVGVPYSDRGADADQGAAYVFVRSGTGWSQQAQFTAAAGDAADFFGGAVALAGDTALVGAYGDDVGANANQGSAYVFARNGTTWSQQAQLVASDGAGQDWFGCSVALQGETALVGTIWHDVDANTNTDQGAAYVFSLLDDGSPLTVASSTPAPNAGGWSREAVSITLSASDAGSGVSSTQYRLAGAPHWTTYTAPFAVSKQGLSTYEYYSTDKAGNVEAIKTLKVRIDSTRPITKALGNVTVTRGRRATLCLRVDDSVAPQATVTVKIYRCGVLKKTLKLGLRATKRKVKYTGYICQLPRGTYTWKVYATDLAGNSAKSPVGQKVLKVK